MRDLTASASVRACAGVCVCARQRERACIAIKPLIEKSSYRIREGTWALPLGVMCETIRFDVWDAIDGQTPPSMREYLLKKKKRAVSVEAERTAAAAVTDEASGAGKHLRDTSTDAASRLRAVFSGAPSVFRVLSKCSTHCEQHTRKVWLHTST